MGSDSHAGPGHVPDAQGPGVMPRAPGASVLRWRQVFPGEERQLGALRRWLVSLLPECPARDDAISVATELASNALCHTASGQGGRFGVEITTHAAVVRVAVADSGGPGEPRVIEDPTAEHGRGLLLVHGLSVRTGVAGDQRGRLVWADIDFGNLDAALSGQAPYEAAIRDEQAALARRFADVPVWFGHSTLAWWALAGPRDLITAPSAGELADRLYHIRRGPYGCRAGTAEAKRWPATRPSSGGNPSSTLRWYRGLPPPWKPPPAAGQAPGDEPAGVVAVRWNAAAATL